MEFGPELFDATERAVMDAVRWLRLAVETLGALVIAAGIAHGAWKLVRLRGGGREGFLKTRLTVARYLALALEFQLAADILSTAIAPTWDQIGKLAAIAVIRTALNWFLTKEMEAETREVQSTARPPG